MESMPLFHQICTFHLELQSGNAKGVVGQFFEPANAARLAGIRKLQVIGIVSIPNSLLTLRFELQVGINGKLIEMPKIESVAARDQFLMDARSVKVNQSRLDTAEAGLRNFYRKLVDRREKAVIEDLNVSKASINGPNRVDEFLASPVAGLGLQSSDLVDLHAIFGQSMSGSEGQEVFWRNTDGQRGRNR